MHRTTRRLTLTEAGAEYLEACQRILPEIDEAEALAASQRIEPRGQLRLNAPLSFGSRFIAPLLPGFSRRHPAVRVELGLRSEEHTSELQSRENLVCRLLLEKKN